MRSALVMLFVAGCSGTPWNFVGGHDVALRGSKFWLETYYRHATYGEPDNPPQYELIMPESITCDEVAIFRQPTEEHQSFRHLCRAVETGTFTFTLRGFGREEEGSIEILSPLGLECRSISCGASFFDSAPASFAQVPPKTTCEIATSLVDGQASFTRPTYTLQTDNPAFLTNQNGLGFKHPITVPESGSARISLIDDVSGTALGVCELTVQSQ